jgi:hypothetical protein
MKHENVVIVEEREIEEKDEEEETTLVCLFLKTSIHRLRLQDQW